MKFKIDTLDVNGNPVSFELSDSHILSQSYNIIDINEAVKNIETKTDHITVTQAVDLDTMESDISTNNAKITYPSADSTKVDFISVTQSVNLDTMESNIATQGSAITDIETKTDYMTISAPVLLDRVPEFKLIMSTLVSVSNSTTEPATNVTLIESIDNYDYIMIDYVYANTVGKFTDIIKLPTNGTLAQISKLYSFGITNQSTIAFLLKRISTTTMTAYYGREITTTYGSPANILSSASSSIDIISIYGIKL